MAAPEAGQWLTTAVKLQAQASPPVIMYMGGVGWGLVIHNSIMLYKVCYAN